MNRFAGLLQTLFGCKAQPRDPVSTRHHVQNLLDELEDPPPANPLLLNLATGFPSALLCVLAAGVLAGALAGREVGGTLQPAATTPAAGEQPAVVLAVASQAAMALPAGAALLGHHAQLQTLELQALQGAPGGTPLASPAGLHQPTRQP
jgi:hypothetical protein